MRSTMIAYCLVEIDAVEFAVGIVEHLAARDAEHFARGREFGAPQICEFLIGAGSAAIARGRSGRHADNEGLDPALVIEQQRSAKSTGFIVRVSGDTKKFAHQAFG